MTRAIDRRLAIPLLLAASSAVGADAGSFTPEQQASYAQCEKRPPASQVKDCAAVIDSQAFQGPQLAGLYVNRANAYDASGDKVQALADYNKAVEIAPDSAAI